MSNTNPAWGNWNHNDWGNVESSRGPGKRVSTHLSGHKQHIRRKDEDRRCLACDRLLPEPALRCFPCNVSHQVRVAEKRKEREKQAAMANQ